MMIAAMERRKSKNSAALNRSKTFANDIFKSGPIPIMAKTGTFKQSLDRQEGLYPWESREFEQSLKKPY